MSTEKINLDIHKILTLLPHRYPILLVDRVLELEPHKSIKALKNVTINEPYFTGHFPKRPVMPGVLILEALAQTAALLTFSEEPHDPESTLYLFVGIDNEITDCRYPTAGPRTSGRLPPPLRRPLPRAP